MFKNSLSREISIIEDLAFDVSAFIEVLTNSCKYNNLTSEYTILDKIYEKQREIIERLSLLYLKK